MLSEPMALSKSRMKLSVQRARGPALVGSQKDMQRDVSADVTFSKVNELRSRVAEAKNGRKVCDMLSLSHELERTFDELDKGGRESAVEGKSEAEKAQSESHMCDTICDRSGADETPPPFLVVHRHRVDKKGGLAKRNEMHRVTDKGILMTS